MTDELLQCCYTNAAKEVDGKISSGWQAVSVSSNIPLEAYNACVKFQNSNSMIQSTRVDEDGNVLNLLEIIGDGSYIYMIRTQYGLLDRLGRPNMFSHAFIMPSRKDDTVSDPNSFLTIANENFRYSEDEANQHYDEVYRLETIELEKALEDCGLTDDCFRTLIQCVYIQYSDSKLAKPLYIQYDGTEENMRNLLFCIYTGLPLAIRRALSVASSEIDGSEGVNILFTRNAATKELFLIPITGENNVLSPRTIRKTSRLGFVEYVVQNHRTLDEAEYFSQLEEKAIELGDPTASNELILKIAHNLLTDPNCSILSNEELQTRLSDMLRSKSIGNKAMDDHIAKMLTAIIERKLALTDENDANLTNRLNSQASAHLVEVAEQYTFYRFNYLPKADAAKKLIMMSSEVFGSYHNKLLNTKEGRDILDYFYMKQLEKVRTGDWNTLGTIVRETANTTGLHQTYNQIVNMAFEFYKADVLENKSHGFKDIVRIFDNYLYILQNYYDVPALEEIALSAKNFFWIQMNFSDFSFDYAEEYFLMENRSGLGSLFGAYARLPQILQRHGPMQNIGDYDCDFFECAHLFFVKAADKFSSADLEVARRKLIEWVIQDRPASDKLFEPWCRLFVNQQINVPFADLFDLYRACQCKEHFNVQRGYERLIRNSDIDSAYVAKRVAELLISWYLSEDSTGSPVELDVWLTLSRGAYGNAFAILDRYHLSITELNPMRVVSASITLGKTLCEADAEAYIRDKGEHARMVKKWISEYNKRNGQEGQQHLISTIMSHPSTSTEKSSGHSEKDKKDGKSFLRGLFGRK